MTYQQLHATASHVAHQSQGKTSKTCKKRKDGVLRKAPQAPRRFKSSYILFFMAKQNEIKRTLPPGSSVSVHFSIVAHLMSIISSEGQKVRSHCVGQPNALKHVLVYITWVQRLPQQLVHIDTNIPRSLKLIVADSIHLSSNLISPIIPNLSPINHR